MDIRHMIRLKAVATHRSIASLERELHIGRGALDKLARGRYGRSTVDRLEAVLDALGLTLVDCDGIVEETDDDYRVVPVDERGLTRRKMRNHKQRARRAVREAIEAGCLTRPSTCDECGAECKPHAHHHMGYDEQHWLDVRFLCVDCHIIAHHGFDDH